MIKISSNITAVLHNLSNNPHGLFVAGDTAQVRNRTCGISGMHTSLPPDYFSRQLIPVRRSQSIYVALRGAATPWATAVGIPDIHD